MVLLFTGGCSALCQIPDEVKRSEELQYRQAVRLNAYLQGIKKNPQVISDPSYERLNQAMQEAASSLAQSTKAQSDYLGHTKASESEVNWAQTEELLKRIIEETKPGPSGGESHGQ